MSIAAELYGTSLKRSVLSDAWSFALRSHEAEIVDECLISNLTMVTDTSSGRTQMPLKLSQPELPDQHLPGQ